MGATKIEIEATGPLVDAEALDELRLVFGDRAGELLARSRQVIAERAAEVRRLADAPDDTLGAFAHEIAGMAGQLGLRPLAAAASRLQAQCAEGVAEAPVSARAVAALADASLAALPAA